ncbi:MAG: FAD-dependent oxidoreductase [Alphaproteobacteria bacterium]|nr:FAD-dependent oxidoreductase [Alphaproteobacteria bacterium]
MPQTIETTCCISGGGPAGMMLGFLLARAGIDVTVLEKHADFLRDFRGDTVHPSTLQLFHELGLLDAFLKLPHEEAPTLAGRIGGDVYRIADFTRLPTRCKYIALVPQWDLLDFLKEHGAQYPSFNVHMLTEATDLVEEDGRVAGVRAKTPDGEIEVRAALTVGCDGRSSTLRARAGFKVKDLGAPLDVLWFRLPTRKGEDQTMGTFAAGAILVQIFRGDYWQCAYVIAKGSADKVRAEGLPSFRERVSRVAPELSDRVDTLTDWDKQIKLLTVSVDRLQQWWKPGLICIGDAAHAMSPIGGVGINLAVQDAVAAANILCEPLSAGVTPEPRYLQRIQKRRMWPTVATQFIQVGVQNGVIGPALKSGKPLHAPFPIRLLGAFPVLQGFPARVVGLGVRPEHVHTPERPGAARPAAQIAS